MKYCLLFSCLLYSYSIFSQNIVLDSIFGNNGIVFTMEVREIKASELYSEESIIYTRNWRQTVFC